MVETILSIALVSTGLAAGQNENIVTPCSNVCPEETSEVPECTPCPGGTVRPPPRPSGPIGTPQALTSYYTPYLNSVLAATKAQLASGAGDAAALRKQLSQLQDAQDRLQKHPGDPATSQALQDLAARGLVPQAGEETPDAATRGRRPYRGFAFGRPAAQKTAAPAAPARGLPPGMAAKAKLLEANFVLKDRPGDPVALAQRAWAKNRAGDYAGAERDARESLRSDPRGVKALNELALALNKRGLFARALEVADKAIAIDPNDAAAHFNRALALEGLGRLSEALKEYELAAALDPAYGGELTAAGLRADGARAGDLAGHSGTDRPEKPQPASAVFWMLGAAGLAGVGLLAWAMLLSRRAAASAAAAAAPSSGPVLLAKTYRLGRPIGSGGMGEVYEGVDAALQRRVAVKRMRSNLKTDRQLMERFMTEARLVAGLSHPNIVTLHAVLQEGGEAYLVFEFLTGETLAALLQRRPFSAPEALPLVRQIAAALDYAHSLRIIHRDLKPGNVMVTRDGVIKVMDFGLAHQARQAADQLSTTEPWGTRPYMAPEQEMGHISKESDIYALGAMTFEMLTGSRPFPGPNFFEQKKALTRAALAAAAPGLGAAAVAAVHRCLAVSPEQRFHSAAEFVAALERAGQPMR